MILNQKKGFTLIELLTVVAIIAILAAVATFMLSSARNKGSDGAIKAAMTSLLTQSTIYYNSAGNYGTMTVLGNCASNFFSADKQTKAIIQNIQNLSGNNIQCNSSPSTFAVIAKFKNLSGYWCVDSNDIASGTAGFAADNLCK